MPAADNIEAFVSVALWIFGSIAVIGGGATLIVKAFSPWRKIRQEVSRHGECLARDKKRLDDADEAQRLQLKAMMILIDHELTNNSVDKLRDVKAEINNYLINK